MFKTGLIVLRDLTAAHKVPRHRRTRPVVTCRVSVLFSKLVPFWFNPATKFLEYPKKQEAKVQQFMEFKASLLFLKSRFYARPMRPCAVPALQLGGAAHTVG